ncbi:tRNA (adenosine(37)-N6)-dimethylallyltransferase MiaA [Candidatus Uabimicrobium amorphum]|uniref:tRNA dimethylallyltransferase n=1 Tax=Uabimicrobium amorphum TaxID=2596890 RepID=A0A5S9F7Z4_UABAM|nr:tRNA (adenosine(37)-N6)-dimethylallyltransferase MiaA [Candidatus Uabimicrobium amorphum]BBM88174.1 tRNA dimethylallyltransferase [Candidatus Uabimicrobium amorphum]
MDPSKFLYVLAGPTGSGKTNSSIKIAQTLDAEIICVDSMSVYKNMDVGTAKVLPHERQKIRHHLLDICEPWEEFNVQKFLHFCIEAIEDIFKRNKKVLLVVGTPLYFKALVEGMFEAPQADEELRKKLELQDSADLHCKLQEIDSEAAERIAVNDRKRVIRALEVFHLTGETISKLQREKTKPAIHYPWGGCCLNWRRDLLYRRIEKRVDMMFEQGLMNETRELLSAKKGISKTAAKAIGYKDVIEVILGEKSEEDLVDVIKRNTRRYAKRQMTWWRSFNMPWIDLDEKNGSTDYIVDEALKIFAKLGPV